MAVLIFASPPCSCRTSASSAALKSRRTTHQSNRSNCLWTQTTLLSLLSSSTRRAAGWRWRQICEKPQWIGGRKYGVSILVRVFTNWAFWVEYNMQYRFLTDFCLITSAKWTPRHVSLWTCLSGSPSFKSLNLFNHNILTMQTEHFKVCFFVKENLRLSCADCLSCCCSVESLFLLVVWDV